MPRRTDIIAPRCSPPLTSLAQPAAGLRPRTRGVYASPRKSEVTAIDDEGGARYGRVRSRRRADRMESPPPLPQAVRRRRSGDGAFPDRGDDEVEAGGTKLLRLGTAVGNPDLYGPSGVNWKVPMRGGACEGRARYRRKLGAGRFMATPPLARLSRHKVVFGRSEGIATMMQSCASAAKLRGGGSILVRGAKAMSAVGSPPPRLVNGGP